MPQEKPMIDGVVLTPAQARLFDECVSKVKGVRNAGAVCVENFRKAHRIVGTGKNRRWVKRKGSEAKA